MNRTAVVCIVALLGGLLWFFPLFHIVRFEENAAVKQGSRFDAAKFAEAFWTERLLPTLDETADAGAVLAALREDSQTARERYGRKVGVSRTRYFVFRGVGRIVTVDKDGVDLTLDNHSGEPDVVLQTGLLFGNTARDATGLLNAGDFPHSQDFNDISTQLNQIIETRVIAELKEKAAVGRAVEFVGCAEIRDDARELRSLAIIPLKVKVE